LNDIIQNENQPRKNFDKEALDDLAKSIKETGLLQPILVRKADGGLFEIVAGERRWRAANAAGISSIPAIVKNLTDRQSFEIGIIENVQRENLSPVEEGLGYKKLISEFGYTQEEVSSLVKKSRPYIANILRLLTLPGEVQDLIDSGKLPYTIARTLVGAENPAALARTILAKGLNARAAEKARKTGDERKRPKPAPDPAVVEIIDSLTQRLAASIDLKMFNESKGEIVIKFDNLLQLDEIVSRLSKIA
jgi:ParB family chromosome partitioning protein